MKYTWNIHEIYMKYAWNSLNVVFLFHSWIRFHYAILQMFRIPCCVEYWLPDSNKILISVGSVSCSSRKVKSALADQTLKIASKKQMIELIHLRLLLLLGKKWAKGPSNIDIFMRLFWNIHYTVENEPCYHQNKETLILYIIITIVIIALLCFFKNIQIFEFYSSFYIFDTTDTNNYSNLSLIF